MAPLQKKHRPSRQTLRPAAQIQHRRDDDQQGEVQQAGRSATNLNAHASAQSLRQASRPSPYTSHTNASTCQSLPKQVSTRTLRTGSHPPPQSSTASLHTPAIPSPLNPKTSTSSSSDESSSDRLCKERASSAAPLSPRAIRRPLSVERKAAPSAQPLLPQPRSSRAFLQPLDMSQIDSSAGLAQDTAPKSVRDLGLDYTRYFNPFATQSNKLGGVIRGASRSLPQIDITATDEQDGHNLVKRLSNPFMDSRRLSNPFLAEGESASGTPGTEWMSQEEQKRPDVIEAVEAARSGTPILIRDADPEKTPFYPWVNDRLGATLPLYDNEKEDDDDMHMPQWDDDRKFRPSLKDRFSRDNIVNTIGVIFLVLGLFTIFIVLPIISFTGTSLIPYTSDTPLDQMLGYGNVPEPWAHVNDHAYPLLQNLRSDLIDPDTPESAKIRQGVDGHTLKLVFSDEFDAKNRTFYPGDDPYWYAPDIWYGATQDLEWYDPDAANTGGGTLQLQLDAFHNHGLDYRSGMLHSWNQLCFKGGVFEVSMSLPGPAGVHGLWPGAWTMGNLGRPGYLATTDGMWPYTYDTCDSGITPNQSMPDGTSYLPGQRVPNCVCKGEDSPTPGTGRGAPEIDIAEISADWGGMNTGVATQSYQVAPFDIFYYPNYDFMETPNYNLSFVNTYTGGPFQQAVSTVTMLNNSWYDGERYQKYAFEYQPGGDGNSHVTWFVGDEETMRFDARAIGPNGNVQQRLVSEEPMSMILNLGLSHGWVAIDQANLKFPTILRVDYVRWYQREDEEMVTCDPPGYETTEYIANHPKAYNNPNYTHWEDAGYSWPRNTLMHGCAA